MLVDVVAVAKARFGGRNGITRGRYLAGEEGENWREISARLTRGRFLAGSCAGLRLIFDFEYFFGFHINIKYQYQ